jgi:hypothetical protein
MLETAEMRDPIPFRRPVRWHDLRTDEAERVIRERVRDTDNVIISEHALLRVNQRFSDTTFTNEDVYWLLESGNVSRRPTKENATEWKVIVVKRMPGTREVGVVTLIATNSNRLFVKTVEWMDWLT